MSQNSRKHRGFRTERVVASYLSQWWENATVGRGYGRDILGVPFDCEVKARAALDIKGTFRQIQARTSKSGLLGFAVFRSNGQGENAQDYAALIRLEDLAELLLKAGYKDRIDTIQDKDITRCLDCGIFTLGERCTYCREPLD
jgi:hypothetical protein